MCEVKIMQLCLFTDFTFRRLQYLADEEFEIPVHAGHAQAGLEKFDGNCFFPFRDELMNEDVYFERGKSGNRQHFVDFKFCEMLCYVFEIWDDM